MVAVDLPLPTVHANKNGTYTHITYRLDDQGRKIQVKRTLKIGRDSEQKAAAIEARKQWTKFGNAKGQNDSETTRIDTEVPLRLSTNPRDLDKDVTSTESEGQRKAKETTIKCRYCNGPHWSKECPSKDIIQSLQEAAGTPQDNAAASAAMDDLLSGNKPAGKYLPPSLRGEGGPGGSMPSRRIEETFAVRIANLPEDTTETDLIDLVQSFGTIVRSFLARFDDGSCKGFAFVNFSSFQAAQAAVNRLDGFGYANLILTCEHSKPREKKN